MDRVGVNVIETAALGRPFQLGMLYDCRKDALIPVCPVTEEVTENTVVLKVPPVCPATVELRLLYKPKQDSVWTSKPVMKDQHTVTLTDLRAGTEYEIRCAVLGKLNYTTDSDVINVTTQGRNRSVMAYCGLMNQGATSYLNAVLQTLYMTQEYKECVMRLEKTIDDSSDGNFTEELKSLFNKLDKESCPVSTAGISRSLGITDVYKHKDAAEYLDLILSKTPESSEIFKGTMEKTAICDSCKQMISDQSDFFTMSISLTESFNVGDALKAHINQLHESSVSCSRCSYRETKANRSDVDFPQILILRLRNVRDYDHLRIPPHTEVSSHSYDLYAIINLYGTLEDGHYNADIKSDDGNCYRCDDSHVFQILDTIFSQNDKTTYEMDGKDGWPKSLAELIPLSRSPAYLLLYKRRIASK